MITLKAKKVHEVLDGTFKKPSENQHDYVEVLCKRGIAQKTCTNGFSFLFRKTLEFPFLNTFHKMKTKGFIYFIYFIFVYN